MRSIIVLILMAMISPQAVYCESLSADEGLWSREAIPFQYHACIPEIDLVSPDGTITILIKGVSICVKVKDKCLSGIENEGVSGLAELMWSPDSSGFVITQSEGGEVGEWNVSVYLIQNSTVHKLDVTQLVVSSFKKHYSCLEPEEPNIGAIRWLNGGKRLLLAAEVPPHSSCPEMGKKRGYIVEIRTGTILQEVSGSDLIDRWRSFLGKRFENGVHTAPR